MAIVLTQAIDSQGEWSACTLDGAIAGPSGLTLGPGLYIGTAIIDWDLASVTDLVDLIVLSWVAQEPTNSSITVEYNISVDGSNTWSGWQGAMSGSDIELISSITDPALLQVQTRFILTTFDLGALPIIESCTLAVDSLSPAPTTTTTTTTAAPTTSTTTTTTAAPTTTTTTTAGYTSVLDSREDGEDLGDANSLVDLTYADSYFLMRGNAAWAALTTVLKDGAMVRAYDYLMVLDWKAGTFDEETPDALCKAQCEAAVREAAQPGCLQADLTKEDYLTSDTVGPISNTYREHKAGGNFPIINRLIAPYLAGGSSSTVSLEIIRS
jgi:hypothetical protein